MIIYAKRTDFSLCGVPRVIWLMAYLISMGYWLHMIKWWLVWSFCVQSGQTNLFWYGFVMENASLIIITPLPFSLFSQVCGWWSRMFLSFCLRKNSLSCLLSLISVGICSAWWIYSILLIRYSLVNVSSCSSGCFNSLWATVRNFVCIIFYGSIRQVYGNSS